MLSHSIRKLIYLNNNSNWCKLVGSNPPSENREYTRCLMMGNSPWPTTKNKCLLEIGLTTYFLLWLFSCVVWVDIFIWSFSNTVLSWKQVPSFLLLRQLISTLTIPNGPWEFPWMMWLSLWWLYTPRMEFLTCCASKWAIEVEAVS